ncbi:hypothetical protein M4D55_20435 [Metabacillus idriensis]|uniref:hypothetical protein n=1 Tax=Metabacillus idriensis TaxID=324768 RepID=UPI0008AA4AF9|nr:hypothetical protein [Metabacillus idriensis]MCM3598134.1 hypothetical protein [Metabacillus idriensis]OHR63723.1 hypothetical protein HMPREF3291_03340 [Bacillus sp. HMSC76G11]
MKKFIFGTSFIALMAFGATAFAASPMEHKTTNQEDCMAMSMKDCMKMMKDNKEKGMSKKDCMKMMKNMQ